MKSLIKIRNEDGEAKSLVFSTWTGGICFSHIGNFTLLSFGMTSVITLFFRRVGYFGGSLG